MDVNLTYRLPAMAWGNVTAGLNRTYLTHCDVLPDTTDPSSVTIHNVGRYTQAYGNFPRWRALGTLSWALNDWSATWRIRYVGHNAIGNSDPDQSLSADSSEPTVVRNIGAYVYNNLQLGYNVEPRHTRFEAGVANIATSSRRCITPTTWAMRTQTWPPTICSALFFTGHARR